MKKESFLLFLSLMQLLITGHAQVNPNQDEIFWKIRDAETIVWDLTGEERLPHSDNIEMSGQNVSGIIHYALDEKKVLTIKRHIIYPQLRVYITSTESGWLNYRAYLKHDYTDDMLPVIVSGGRTFEPGPVDSVCINGMLNFYHAPQGGLAVKRTLLPSMTERLFLENWQITNVTDSIVKLFIGSTEYKHSQQGIDGNYTRIVSSDAQQNVTILPGDIYEFGVYFTAYLNDEPELQTTSEMVIEARTAFLDTISEQLILQTPDPVLDHLFYFSKIRAAESIFKTSMGLVHSPGGGRYYTGVWANDQAEYSGPFFPYLGYETGNIAALNAYRVFLKNIPEGDGHFWSSFEMNGELTCCGADRGDAAMIAFGASHYALAIGDKAIAKELWPLIEWSLEYCDRQKNEEGVIESDTDEMEGRIPTGKANLSTSSLYYGALLLAADLGREINIPNKQLKGYVNEASDLRRSMESYFGATLEGLDTYRYFIGHQYLRHWICLPLVMGINDRKEGTLDALFSKLWNNNGVRVEHNPDLEEPDLFWDRGTLYAFRGAFKAGGTNRAIEKLQAYSQTRLLGFHVPYVVEAWPEGNMAHLSAESALYCRIFTEGLLGMNPTGLDRFTIAPGMPAAWDTYELRHIKAFGKDFDVVVTRVEDQIRLQVSSGEAEIYNALIHENEMVEVKF